MKRKPRTQKSSLYKATALLMLVFVTGTVTGAAIMRLLDTPRRPKTPGAVHLTPPGLENLHLSKEQQERAHEIGEKYRPQLEAIRKEIEPRVEKIHGKMQQELFKILTPAQRRAHNRHMSPPHDNRAITPPMRPGAPPPMVEKGTVHRGRPYRHVRKKLGRFLRLHLPSWRYHLRGLSQPAWHSGALLSPLFSLTNTLFMGESPV